MSTLILAFDTSAAHVGAALFDGSDLIAAAHEDMARGQAERLMPLLEETLAQAGATWANLAAIGVGIGPGNFTGIRISVSAARGLALGLGVPAVGVSMLEAVSFGTPGPRLACVGAPRDQLYVQSFDMAASVDPALIALASVSADWAEPGLTCIGTAAEQAAQVLGAAHAPATFAPASAIARITAQRWQSSPERPAPMYLRPADAAPGRDTPPVILDDA
ncbi:tRNA (adenosine(37)-N6)-threonylcarbamoyltransferase complex dimerization subunit type 1 TsaB [Pseudoprimorskyibacter insulae]|uniref:tRNA threonylcarbamoyladenosine biosynthesis protein TsaB n=1 Tax=Pseudoprimorskyibacter insulae TaxID=1695997 RepID=A0A2R8AUQ0_9RHOB|nr:tRNA (adenosine(37)-N6)-threonylcarbamoyltransferase complex dimerization subunit type 1 TsaB [Pseudoprimorskyibacter insulae]SPF79768.1 tRNA threonylcarbamoyladenosine biosynthesis protein TsaB [Pseudoprimorskyibacter insulae]